MDTQAITASAPKRATPKNDIEIGGIYCGKEIDKDLFAEELTSRRYVIRKRIEPNYAKRMGEVCGGKQLGGGCEYQATKMNGEHVAMRNTLLSAALTLTTSN